MGKQVLVVCSILIGQCLLAQQKEVSGAVTDRDGLPLGVNIVIQGTTTGTQTDFDGNYQITTEIGQTIVYSFIGFENHTEIIREDGELNVALEQDDNTLDEVVVTGFGRIVTRNESTSSVSSISAADFQKSPRPDPRDVLQGGATENIKVFGYAEVLLNYAEAFLDTVEALTYLNQVASARNATPYSVANMDNIMKERRKKFIYEGFRFHDLARTGRDIRSIDNSTPNNHGLVKAGGHRFALPISRHELDSNDAMVQNPGYAGRN